MSFLLTTAMFFASTGTPDLFEIPRKYWGEYNSVLEDCGTGTNDSRLRVSWDSIYFYESSGTIKELLRQPDDTLVVVAEHTGEGQTWTNVYQMRLSADNNKLTIIHPQTAEMDQFQSDRFRCPANG